MLNQPTEGNQCKSHHSGGMLVLGISQAVLVHWFLYLWFLLLFLLPMSLLTRRICTESPWYIYFFIGIIFIVDDRCWVFHISQSLMPVVYVLLSCTNCTEYVLWMHDRRWSTRYSAYFYFDMNSYFITFDLIRSLIILFAAFTAFNYEEERASGSHRTRNGRDTSLISNT
jgi:hypothetical protein